MGRRHHGAPPEAAQEIQRLQQQLTQMEAQRETRLREAIARLKVDYQQHTNRELAAQRLRHQQEIQGLREQLGPQHSPGNNPDPQTPEP